MTVDNTTAKDVEILLQISDLFQHLDTTHLLKELLRLCTQVVQTTNGSIILFRDGQVDWQYIIHIKEHRADRVEQIVRRILTQGLAGWVQTHRKIGIVKNAQEDPRWLPERATGEFVQSALCVPVIHQDDLVAIITVESPTEDYFTEHHVKLMTIIANQAAIAIYNARLFEQLDAQRQQLKAIMGAFPDTLLVMDHVGRILVTNDAMLTLLGATSHQATQGERLTDMPNRDSCLDRICEFLLESLDDDKQPVQNQSYTVTSETLKHDYQVTMAAWGNPDQPVAGYVVVMHDITRLRDLDRFKDEMLRIASHDLRSPLALIIGYADMIGLDTFDPVSPVHDHVTAILRSANRMDRLLEDILRIESIRQTPLELHEALHPKPIVDDVVSHLRSQAERKQIRFGAQTNLDFVNTHVLADPVLIRQTMENLITNALKYTPPGGKVAVIARFDFEKRRFNFTVADTGIGIPEDKLPYVFESFYRVNQPDAKGIQGTGLGLSLVKNVIEQHQGEVWVTSVENQGSRFGFWLPLIQTT